MTDTTAIKPQTRPTITVAVPAYSRPSELCDLIDSVLNCGKLPDELLIVEDNSPHRADIRDLVERYREKFSQTTCLLRHSQNEVNLGYDGNLRKAIEESSSEYVIVLGNDDALLPDAVQEVCRFVEENPDVNFISRSYTRFSGETTNIINTVWLSKSDATFNRHNSDSGLIFKLSGFVGGLIIKRDWARSISRSTYDGTLYYQFYLACVAYVEQGIGYIAKPTALGRADNPPLFGAAATEREFHTPGSYTPKGRAEMWSGILRIARDVDEEYDASLLDGVRHELSHRQSFHIFEMMSAQGRRATVSLFAELRKLGLTSDWLPWALAGYIAIFGKRSEIGFAALRRLQFAFEKNLRVKL